MDFPGGGVAGPAVRGMRLAGFAAAASRSGARTIEVNLEPSAVENAFHEHRYGEAGVLVPQLAAELLGPAAGGLLRQRPPRLD